MSAATRSTKQENSLCTSKKAILIHNAPKKQALALAVVVLYLRCLIPCKSSIRVKYQFSSSTYNHRSRLQDPSDFLQTV